MGCHYLGFYPGLRNAVYHEMTNSQIYRNPGLTAKVSRENFKIPKFGLFNMWVILIPLRCLLRKE